MIGHLAQLSWHCSEWSDTNFTIVKIHATLHDKLVFGQCEVATFARSLGLNWLHSGHIAVGSFRSAQFLIERLPSVELDVVVCVLHKLIESIKLYYLGACHRRERPREMPRGGGVR